MYNDIQYIAHHQEPCIQIQFGGSPPYHIMKPSYASFSLIYGIMLAHCGHSQRGHCIRHSAHTGDRTEKLSWTSFIDHRIGKNVRVTALAPVRLAVFRLNSKSDQNLECCSFICSTYRNKISQFHCHDVYKIWLWSAEYIFNLST